MNFQQAAVSWFGLPEHAQVMGGEAAGQLVFVVMPTADDLAGIAQRMQQVDPEPEPVPEQRAPTNEEVRARWDTLSAAATNEEVRARWDTLSAAAKSHYGSFGRFRQMQGGSAQFEVEGLPGEWKQADPAPTYPTAAVPRREVQHVDVAEQEDSGLPAAVWLPVSQLVGKQRQFCSDDRHVEGVMEPEALIQVDMLTPEQKAKYCK